PPRTGPPRHPGASWADFRADAQQRSIAVAVADIDGADRIALAFDADFPDGPREPRVGGHEEERPVRETPLEPDAEETLQRLPISGKRRADALDEGRHLRIVAQRHEVGAMPAMRRQHAVLEDQRLGPGVQSALLETVGCVVEQLPRWLEGAIENGEPLHLGEGDVSMAAGGERLQQPLVLHRM